SRRRGERQWVLGVGATWRLYRSGMMAASGDSRRDSCASSGATLPTRRPAPIVAATVAAARRKQTEMITIWLSLFAPALGRCHLPRGRARVQPWTLLSRGVPGARSSCLLFGGRRGARGYGAFLRDCP